MKLPILITLLALSSHAQVSENFRQRVEMRESRGRNVAGKDGEVGPMQLKPSAFIDANKFRRKQGLKTYPLAQIWNPEVNRIVGKSFLDLQQARLRKHLKREPTEAELYESYRYGFAGFKRRQK